MRIDVAKAFNLNADDPEGWKKAITFALVVFLCALGGFLILPFLFLMLYSPGYMVQYVRNVATGDNNKQLPVVMNTGVLWHGFMLAIVGMIYSLPLMGVLAVGLGGGIAAIASGASMDSALVSMGGLAGIGLMGVVACLLGLVIAAFMPMVLLQYCRNFQFGEAFNVGAIFSGMMRSPGDYLLVLVVPFAVNCVVAMIPFVGIFLSPIVTLIGANLIGQYGAKVLEMGDDTPALPADVGFSKF